ncbi:MAG: 3-phosphoshikimate 1-carboxyvinyltransferase [Candidatus Latescibacteria bacterium]|jgi:3-phosphoshikimate 1-carboxyvinyltransferase|nr:3-phosphoshikimate 1-carboxyvinyltransferase [Candidatus Latescibacterota bacterium]
MSQTLRIDPLDGPVDADVQIPGSKSYTNRALIIAALAEGTSRLSGALFSDDTDCMAAALATLGVEIDADPERESFTVCGAGGRIPIGRADLDTGNSGTSARFLTAYVSLGDGSFMLDGLPRMRERPIQDLLDGLGSLGVNARSKLGNGCPPVVVEADGLKGGRTSMAGSHSSQYFTALLLVAPYAREDICIEVLGDLVSKPYVDITIGIMHEFGVEVHNESYRSFHVASGQRYAARDYTVEPDASNASYFLAAAALTGGRVRVSGLTRRSAQGDVRFVDLLERMGCQTCEYADSIEVRGPRQLSGIEADLNDTPDLVQTMCALAPFASSPVTVRNVANLRLKETDRIAALEAELRKLGVETHTREDGLTVHPAERILPAELDTYDDHRMAMSLALVGLVAPGIVLRDPQCVGKTFPTYFELLEKLR